MSTTLPEPAVRIATPESDVDPQDRIGESLQDRMPEWFRMPKSFAMFCLLTGSLYFLLSTFPIWHTDVWAHLAYGRLISATKQLPVTEPLMPLSEGVPFVDSAWLGQVVAYKMVERYGYSAVRFLFAFSIAASFGMLVVRMMRRTDSIAWTLLGGAAWLWLNMQQFLVRPQLAAVAFYIAVYLLGTARSFPRWGWIAIPGLFAVWANIHGSFPVGIAVLGALCVGRAADLILRTNRTVSVFHDRRVRQLLLMTQLGVLGTLLNPYGAALWAEVISIANHPNLTDIVEWDSLNLRMKQGQAAAAIALALVIAFRLSPRRISVGEVLLHVGLGAATLWTSRMIVWWAPVAVCSLAIHGHAAYERFAGKRLILEPTSRRSLWTVAGLGIFLVCFVWSPFGQALAHPGKRANTSKFSPETPLGAVEYLRKNPPSGQVFNSQELGDYLMWAGPPGMKVFVGSHVHLVPTEVWRDYFVALNLSNGWDDVLDQYGVTTVVLDNGSRSTLLRALKRNVENWRVGYEDNATTVFIRRAPL